MFGGGSVAVISIFIIARRIINRKTERSFIFFTILYLVVSEKVF
jgi:hypothetical protein